MRLLGRFQSFLSRRRRREGVEVIDSPSRWLVIQGTTAVSMPDWDSARSLLLKLWRPALNRALDDPELVGEFSQAAVIRTYETYLRQIIELEPDENWGVQGYGIVRRS
jgi:hypothetical protein